MSLEPIETNFRYYLSPSSFFKPQFLTESAWVQHIPFAFWLVEQLQPRIVVELGVHSGVSYFSFCQSVKANNVPAQCFGVDTWKGDEHSGLYDENIWSVAADHNGREYAAFSTLLRTTFDGALPYFEDGTIDLLHIDGFHTYEAVRSDFENWLPKMSGRGIVLFHDIGVRERDFGVFKFWTELKQQYKSFEFFHGHGLGIITLDPSQKSEVLKNLFGLTDETEINRIRSVYAALGSRFKENLDAQRAHQQLAINGAQQASLQQQLAEEGQKSSALLAQIENHKAQLEGLQVETGRLRNDLLSANDTTSQLRAETERIRAQLQNVQEISGVDKEAYRTEHERIQEELALHKEQSSALAQEVTQLQAALEDQTRQAATEARNAQAEREEATAAIEQQAIKSNQQLKEKEEELLAATSELFKAKQDLQALASAKEKEQLMSKMAQTESERLQAELASSRLELQSLEKQFATLKEQYEVATQEILFLHTEREEAGQTARAYKDELKNLKAKSEQLDTQLGQLESHYNRYQLNAENERAEAADRNSKAASHAGELEKVIEHLQRDIAWYKRTYADRSLLGVVKEKYLNGTKSSFSGLLNSLLKNKSIQKKYAATYLLEYARDQGIKRTITATGNAFKEHGIAALTDSRGILHKKVQKRYASGMFLMPATTSRTGASIQKSDIEQLKYQPKISLVFPTYNTKPELLSRAIESIRAQAYTNFEICIVDDASTTAKTREVLQQYNKEQNINVVFLSKNSGISEASNEAIKRTTGDYIALMDHDDEITPDALYWIVKEINESRADIIYTDECKVDEQGNLSDFFLKPGWSPELMFNMMYVGHLTVYKKSFLLGKVGVFRKEYDFSQDYDLMLRAVEQTDNIRHIPRVLYHWGITEGSASQGDKPYARITNLKALEDAARRRNLEGDIIELPTANRLKLKLDLSRKVSILVPTDSYANLKESIESIIDNTSYPSYEIVPVTNSKLIRQMSEMVKDTRIAYAPYDKPYNFSDKCNVGAKQASGEIVIFFNDDVRPLQKDWIENTIEFLNVPGVGGVSPKLIYENDTIQYAGMASGVRNLTGTTFHCYPKDSTHYINFPQLVRDVSILSGACMAMKKDFFLELKGFDPVNAPSAHSDVDLSFKILEAGQRCVYTPYALLRHIGHLSLTDHESKEPKTKKDKADIFLLKRWPAFVAEDKYFTGPMRDLLYHDSPEPYKIFAAEKITAWGNSGDVLLVSHDLSLSGAPIMLYDIARVLVSKGFFVVVGCPDDGPLRKMYQAAGITVIIDTLILRQHHSFEKFAKNFDHIICNTVVTWPVVKQMENLVNTLWWIQEGQVLNLFVDTPGFVETLRNAKNLVGVSDYNISYVLPYNKKITKVYNACPDVLANKPVTAPKKTGKVVFSLVGSVESRKGHDILISALEQLPKDLLQQVEVWFIGRVLDQHFFQTLQERIQRLGCIKMVGEKNHDECLVLIRESDVVLNVSRDDPFPVVLVEAMCLEKVCVVSTNSGVSELLTTGENGYVFQNENAGDLAEKLTSVIVSKNRERVGQMARKTYEQYLTMEKFEGQLLQAMSVQNKKP